MNKEKQFGQYAVILTLPSIRFGKIKGIYGIFLQTHIVFRKDCEWWRDWAVGFAILGFGLGLEKRKK